VKRETGEARERFPSRMIERLEKKREIRFIS
jgi:hypothetical protein